VLVEDVDAPVLDDDARHHLRRVLRLRPGAVVCATDGAGRWRPTVLSGGAELEPTGAVEAEPAPSSVLGVAFVPVKGDRPELVVQKLTEVGVDRILVCTSERAVVRWDGERADRHLDRLRRVAREASQQCRRLWLPEVSPAEIDGLLADGAVPADLGGRPISSADRTVVIGPEGGWTGRERDRARSAGASAVSLGPHVLRAETAAISAGVLLVAARTGAAPRSTP
jgi:16S rRNA (uracil1498-N3)-methyltransferase